ncbi:MAG: hypothetical protein JSR43_07245, partial [Proteobacteria bacterium]|nr:hypothetical protein [Pseudomonadota bacterium]
EAAVAHAGRALAAARRCGGLERATVLRVVARVRLRTRGADARCERLLALALALARRHGSADLQARVLSLMVVQRVQQPQPPLGAAASLALRREALALWQQHGPQARVTEGLVNLALGLGSTRAERLEKLELLELARRAAAARGQWRLLAFGHSIRAYVLADLRRWDEAAAAHLQCLQLAWDGAMWREWFYGLWNLPRTLAHRGRPEAAARLMGFANAFGERHFGTLGPLDLAERRRTRRLVRVQCGSERAEALWQAGRKLDMAQAMQLAQAEAQALCRPPDGAAAPACAPD